MPSRRPPAPRPPPLPRRDTIEVEASWLEKDSIPPPDKPSSPPRKRTRPSLPRVPGAPSGHMPRQTMEVEASWLETEEAAPAPQAKRARQAWEPPTLPPPPPTAARARKAIPPPLPRGEDEETPAKRPSKKPPKRG